jgi:hypothetical protein
MDTDIKEQQDEVISANEQALLDRRGFLLGLKKWSKIVIGGALVGGALLDPGREREAAAWVNRGGGGAWANRGGGAAWANRGPSWANRGPSWANRGPSWANRGASWANRGPVWANRGAAWANRGTSWVNRF